MPIERPVPLKREEWSFFDRQKSIFSSMNAGKEDLWKDFDEELEKIRKEMFQLTPMDGGKGGSSIMPALTSLSSGSPSGSPGSTKKVTSSVSKTVTSKTTSSRTTGGKTESSFQSSFDSSFQTGLGSNALDAAFGSDMVPSLSGGSSMLDSSNVLKVERPFVTDLDGNKKLSLRFDVSKFNPEEIAVKTLDNKLMVGAKHSEETATSKVYREFSKQYVLPTKIDPMHLSSILSKDGVLSIEAPAPDAIEAPKERILPINRLAF